MVHLTGLGQFPRHKWWRRLPPRHGPSQNFVPDFIFKGSALTGWHKLGAADWRAENGEIAGAPGDNGGWLVLDKSHQDVGFFASFRSAPASKAGVLLRAEQMSDGMKGIFKTRSNWRKSGYEEWREEQFWCLLLSVADCGSRL